MMNDEVKDNWNVACVRIDSAYNKWFDSVNHILPKNNGLAKLYIGSSNATDKIIDEELKTSITKAGSKRKYDGNVEDLPHPPYVYVRKDGAKPDDENCEYSTKGPNSKPGGNNFTSNLLSESLRRAEEQFIQGQRHLESVKKCRDIARKHHEMIKRVYDEYPHFMRRLMDLSNDNLIYSEETLTAETKTLDDKKKMVDKMKSFLKSK